MSNPFIGCESSYKDASLVIFGAPFDDTSSYRPGSRFAPAAIRNESYAIETYSPDLDLDLLDYRIHDGGDLELPFGASKAALTLIRKRASKILNNGNTPVMLGGEHLITLSAVQAAHALYPDLHIVHFDAHTDLREDYLGVKLSHATVIKRCWELIGDGRIHQFGIRSGLREEFLWAAGHTELRKFDTSGVETLEKRIGNAPVYLTIDLDVLDPGIFPGTGTPEAGGLSYNELIAALKHVTRLRVIGADIVELSPPYDNSGVSTLTACKLLRELLLMLAAR